MVSGIHGINPFVFLLHVIEDTERVAEPLARALASVGLRILFQNHRVPLPLPRETGTWDDRSKGVSFESVLRDAPIEEEWSLRRRILCGLREAGMGIVVVTPAFAGRAWPVEQIAGFQSAANEWGERLILLFSDSNGEPHPGSHAFMNINAKSIIGNSHDIVAYSISKQVHQYWSYPKHRCSAAKSEIRDLLGLLACTYCRSRPVLEHAGIRFATLDATELLLCPRCGCGYYVRNAMPDVVAGNEVLMDFPTPPRP